MLCKMNLLQNNTSYEYPTSKNRITEIDVLLVELQQERKDIEKYISENSEPMDDIVLCNLLDTDNRSNYVRTLNCLQSG